MVCAKHKNLTPKIYFFELLANFLCFLNNDLKAGFVLKSSIRLNLFASMIRENGHTATMTQEEEIEKIQTLQICWKK
jgi:hypothetical protein